MFRPASRLIARPSVVRAIPRATAPARRFVSTAPPTQKSRSWKSLVARLGAVGAIIYYYNTTDVFAEEPKHLVHALPETENESEQLPTIEAISAERQKRRAAIEAELAKQEAIAQEAQAAGGIEGLEQEADQQGAFNPETGEINWDCPCLGGMADGPCGPEFKAAFSCFVYSTDEPKGMDCVDKFKDMQNCFRQYPEVYGSELENDEEEEATLDAPLDENHPASAVAAEKASADPHPSSEPSVATETSKTRGKQETGLVPESYKPEGESQQDKSVDAVSESKELVPKAAHNATEANAEKK